MTSEKRDAVVVPAFGVSSSVAAVRALGRADVDTITVSPDSTAPASFSRYCSESVTVPSPQNSLSAYGDALLDIAVREDVKAILPLREADIYVLADNRSSFAPYIEPVWPSFETLGKVQDRHTLLSIAADIDVPTPDSQRLTEWPDTESPLVVKSRYAIEVDEESLGASYAGVEVVGPDDTTSVDEMVDEMGHVPLVQEFVPNGGEYGFFALYDHGDPVVTFQHRRVRSSTYTGGHSVYRKSVDVDELETYGRRLLDELDWHGPAMVEFRRDERDGTFRLMEVNPRFWGSLTLPIYSGVNFPYLYYRLAVGDQRPASGTYQRDVGSHILWGELVYLYTVWAGNEHEEPPPFPNEVVDVARSWLEQPNFDYLSVTDPLPFLVDLRNIGTELLPVAGPSRN